ncbi:unnamed protein product [Phytophthora fragariaefolia]|uniref:Unnamed protein product n=1 Tax=Phytophthora fragariaefolia TaxID=1490495 RepID=A0A9W6WQM0_9STRA|nr:unnamed protein product [Phytophthora fragariaefolia]
MSLLAFRYVIEHVPGEANAWGDLLSRWGAGSALKQERTSRRVARLAVVQRVSPLEDPEFVWPAETEIRVLQQVARDDNSDLQGAQWSEQRQLLLTAAGQVWIPGDATDMQQRLCVVAHPGVSGHRGSRATTQALEAVLCWRTMAKDVAEFVAGCLHCMATASGRIPRPFGETLKATKPNEVLHFDYLTMVEGEGGNKYILVLEDGMSGYVELIACLQANSDNAYHGLCSGATHSGNLHISATSTLVQHALMDTFRWATCSVVTIHSRKHYYWQKATDICQ